MRVETRLNAGRLLALDQKVAFAALDVCLAGATATVRDAREQVETIHGAGVHYPGLPNQSSAPGQAPQHQFGALLDSIALDQEEVQGIGADAVAGDGTGVATALEGGTSRIAPRPFMDPASVVGTEAAQARLTQVATELGRP